MFSATAACNVRVYVRVWVSVTAALFCSWLPDAIRWNPTSFRHVRDAEKNILQCEYGCPKPEPRPESCPGSPLGSTNIVPKMECGIISYGCTLLPVFRYRLDQVVCLTSSLVVLRYFLYVHCFLTRLVDYFI